MSVPGKGDWSPAYLEDKAVDTAQMEAWDDMEGRLQEDERGRYECPRCAYARDDAEQRQGVTYGGHEPSLSRRTQPVTLAEEESVEDVSARDEDKDYRNFDAEDFAKLQRSGEHVGLYERSVYCKEHDEVFVTGIAQGEGEIQDGYLQAVLYAE